MEIKIVHLYPDLLNLYGDKGNICSLLKRCEWRGISASVTEITGNDEINLEDCDILYLGGGAEHEQEIVLGRLMPLKEKIKEYAENGGTIFATCGGFGMLGELGVLNIRTTKNDERNSGNVVLECNFDGEKVLVSGFENHVYKTDIGDLMPLGDVLTGFGNNGMGFEGALYKNVVASNLHGPLLPKNPALCDFILKKALVKKYGEKIDLKPLCDSFENIASKNIIKSVMGETK